MKIVVLDGFTLNPGDNPWEPVDSSAAAIAAQGLLRLGRRLGGKGGKKYYQAGADGLCVWDAERRTARFSEWAAVKKLGHINMLDTIIKQGPSYYRAVDLKYLGGFDVKWSFKDG